MNRKSGYKDLDKWRKTKRLQQRRYHQKTANAPNSRQPYTVDEIEMILRHDIPDSELSSRIGRSVRAIQAKRHNLRKGGDKNRS